MSAQAKTALVVLTSWRQNVRRRPTLSETMALARAFSDGDFTGESRCIRNAAGLMKSDAEAHWLMYPRLEYATIRDYLITEHDADPRTAAACALRMTTFRSSFS